MRELSEHTIGALQWIADSRRDWSEERKAAGDDDPWAAIADAAEAVLKSPTTDELGKQDRELFKELDIEAGDSTRPAVAKAIENDMIRAGWGERHDPEVVRNYRVRTRVIDGVRYVVWH